MKDFLKVQMYRWMKRERQANKVFLRFALAYNSRGTVFDPTFRRRVDGKKDFE